LQIEDLQTAAFEFAMANFQFAMSVPDIGEKQ
jgi:hypothetical protein